LGSNEPESLSEREFAAELEDHMGEILFGTPRSPSEAARAEEQGETVYDSPPLPPTTEPGEEEPVVEPEEAPTEEEGEEEEPETLEDEGLAWARRKYGEDVSLAKIAKVAFDQEQTISRLGNQKREADDLAGQWYQYSQNLERQLQAQPSGMPISSAEENWVEQSLTNPLQYAVQAKMQGNEQLYRAVINRVAQEDPVVAGQIAAYAEMTMAEQTRAQAANENGAGTDIATTIQASLQRLGIDLNRYGQPMMQKIGELGEFHPYTQAILSGSDQERDLAFQAVYDLVREGRVTRRVVRDEERESQIAREGELRRQAAGVLTGGPRSSAPPPQSPFMDAMEAEWRRRGQWRDDE